MEGSDIATIIVAVIGLISAALAAFITTRDSVKRIQQLKELRDSLSGTEWDKDRKKVDLLIEDSVDELYRGYQARPYFILSFLLFFETLALILLALSPLITDMMEFVVDLVVAAVTFVISLVIFIIGSFKRVEKSKDNKEE